MEETDNGEIGLIEQRGQTGSKVGSYAGGYFAGPIGAAIGQQQVGDTVESRDVNDTSKNNEEEEKKRGGGGCSGNSSSQPQEPDKATPDNSPDTPKFKLQIEKNDIPENWWDKLPDIDPRVYDAISMEKAAACVNYINQGLPDMNELRNMVCSNQFKMTCPRLRVAVPRTKVIKPKEIKYTTKIDEFIKNDQTY